VCVCVFVCLCVCVCVCVCFVCVCMRGCVEHCSLRHISHCGRVPFGRNLLVMFSPGWDVPSSTSSAEQQSISYRGHFWVMRRFTQVPSHACRHDRVAVYRSRDIFLQTQALYFEDQSSMQVCVCV
jgi:hypothetical protein